MTATATATKTSLKPCANGRNIVGQQLPALVGCYMLRPFAHTVACCWMLLRVVAQSLKPVKLFSQQLIPNISFVPLSTKRNATMLDPFAQLSQHCWGRARSLRMVFKDLWVVSFPRCTAGPDIVGNCYIRCTPLPTRTEQLPTLLAQQCSTMLGVVASVCTQP